MDKTTLIPIPNSLNTVGGVDYINVVVQKGNKSYWATVRHSAYKIEAWMQANRLTETQKARLRRLIEEENYQSRLENEGGN